MREVCFLPAFLLAFAAAGGAFAAAAHDPKRPKEPASPTDAAGECQSLLSLYDSPSILAGYFSQIRAPSPSKIGKYASAVISATQDKQFEALGIHNGHVLLTGPHDAALSLKTHDKRGIRHVSLIESADGLHLLTVGEDAQIHLFRISYDGYELQAAQAAALDLSRDTPTVFAQDADLGLFAFGTVDGNVEVRLLGSGTIVREAKAALDGETIAGLAFDAEKRDLLIVGYRGAFARLPLKGGAALKRGPRPPAPAVSVNRFEAALFHTNSIVARADGVLELRALATHEKLAERRVSRAPLTATYLNVDGDFALVGDLDGDVYAIDALAIDALKVLHRLPCPPEIVRGGYAGREVLKITMDDSNTPEWIDVYYRSGHKARFEMMETN